MFGIAKDVEAVRRAFGGRGCQIRISDPLEPPVVSDLAIHLEVPAYVWMPWSVRNVLVVNPEWFSVDAWRPYLAKFDAVVVKDIATQAIFQEDLSQKTHVIPWGLPATTHPAVRKKQDAFLWMLGASKSKRAYVPRIVSVWKTAWPTLLITTTTPLDLSGMAVPANVEIRIGDMDREERERLAAAYRGHICCSTAEGFGYTAAEAEDLGAFTILNRLPIYEGTYGDVSGVHFLPATPERKGVAYVDTGRVPEHEMEAALGEAIAAFWSHGDAIAKAKQQSSRKRWAAFTNAWADLYEPFLGQKRPADYKVMPPPLDRASCPPISVVTLIHNRKKFFDLACHNIMISDYPKDKIEWIIVDDSDDPMEQNSDRIVAVAESAAPVKVSYMPLAKKKSVAEKRNLGVAKASADIILMMDDDDHYPETSFRRRVGWLTGHPWRPRAAACTTIACYDLQKGISAVNVPPTDLPLGQRISEATLTFYKSWWEAKGFPAGIIVGEAEEFVAGRETDLLELPPQQIIVAFSHGKNVSSRRVPSGADVKPGCFWGFPREFLEFIHGLVGVKVVAA
jgi:hypothetical protein